MLARLARRWHAAQAMPDHRLFVALPLPEEVREALLDPMEGLVGVRWQDADNLHVTLRFIGEVDRRQADDIVLALEQVAVRRFDVALRGVGHFARKGRATALWAAVVPCPALDELQARVEQACRRAGLAAETRKFVPHVTLARLNAGSGALGGWLARHGTLAAGPWPVTGFALYESHLRAGGAFYEERLRFPGT